MGSFSEEFSIVTKLTPAEVQAKLDELLDANNYQFNGYAFDGVFKLQPAPSAKKSFGPEIEGSIEAWDGGSRIKANLKMAKSMRLLLQVFIGVMIVGIILMVVGLLLSKKGHGPFFPWFLLFFLYIPIIGNFQKEGKKIKQCLVNAVEGEERSA